MIKTRIAVCSVVAFVGMLALSPGPSEANPAYVYVILKKMPSWELKVVDPKGPDICRSGVSFPICDDQDSITWVLTITGPPPHELEENQRVRIVEIEGQADDCFGGDGPDSWIIEGPDENTAESGHPVCEGEKYGILWPYDIVFEQYNEDTERWDEVTRIDPRGIVH